MGKIDFIQALDKSSSDDESIWAMDAVGLHPDPVVETTSLEGVTLPQREYAFVLPEETRSRLLSAVQLESIKHSCVKHEQTLPDGSRAVFFIGDFFDLCQIEQLASSVPPNTVDQLIDELGGPENMAEMTG